MGWVKAYQKETGRVHLELNVCIRQQLIHSCTTQAVNHHAPAQNAANRTVFLAWHQHLLPTGHRSAFLLDKWENQSVFLHEKSRGCSLLWFEGSPKFILEDIHHCDLLKVVREWSLGLSEIYLLNRSSFKLPTNNLPTPISGHSWLY